MSSDPIHKNSNLEVRIGMVQINANFSGQEYLPLSGGMLWSFLRKHSKFAEELKLEALFHKRENPEDLANKLSRCKIVGFSLYVWNEQISFSVMKHLKNISPSTIIICGGPQVPDFAKSYLEEHPYIDFVVHG